MWLIFITTALAIAVVLFLVKMLRHKKIDLKNKHVVITGGSSGIGKCLAQQALEAGAKVTIVARNVTKLEQTVDLLRESVQNATVHCASVDLGGNIETIEKEFESIVDKMGDIDILINCAGSAVSYRFHESPKDAFGNMMNVNYFSAVNATLASIKSLQKCARTKGYAGVVYVSSLAGVFGLYGYSAYSPSKFALVGLAECLRMEYAHKNICVTVAFPPDTDTPGFALEQVTKPIETKKLSEGASLVAPEYVAKILLNDVLLQRFSSSVGWEGWLLVTATSGLRPWTSMGEVLIQVLLASPLRAIGAALQYYFLQVVRSYSN